MRIRNNLILLLLFIITDLTAQTLKAAFDDALNLYQSKNYSSAYDLFKSISRDKSVNENEKSSSLLYAAECLSKLNQLDGAASEYESFLKLYPQSSFRESVLYELGTIYYHNREFRKARENLSRLIYEYPLSTNLGSAYYWLGESFSAENKFIDAEENFKEAISRRNENNFITNSIYALGLLYERTGDYNSAVTHYDELLTYYRNSPLAPRTQLRIGICYFALKEYDSAVLELTDPQINNLTSQEIVEAKYFLANSFIRLKDYKNAATIFEELKSDSNDQFFHNKINYSLAWIKFQKNEFSDAFKIFDELARIENDTIAIQSLFWSGECKRYLGESILANEIFDRFLKKYPDHSFAARAQLGKGTSYFSQNLSQEAETSLYKAINSNDLYARGKAYSLLGELKLNQKLFSESKNYFLESIKLTANIPGIYNGAVLGLGVSEFFLGNYDGAVRNLEIIKKRAKDFETDKTNFYLAESYLMRGEYSAAIKHYNQISADNNELKKPSIYGKAYAYFNLKDFPNAIYYFNEYVTKYRNDQNVNDARLRLADSYFGIKNFDKASQIYRELFTSDKLISNDDQTYYQYCQSLFKAGKSNNAIEEFIKLQQKFPRSRFADASQYVVGWIYFQQNNFRAAIENYEKLLTKYPSSSLKPIAFYSIGDSYFNLGDYEASINYYNRVLTEFPNTPYILDAVNGIQFAYLAKEEPENAVSFIDQFVAINPSSKYSDQIFIKKGDIYYSSNDYNNAIIAYQEFIQKFPSSALIPNAYYWIGKSAEFLKRETEAIDNFNKVLSINLKSTIGISAAIDLANIYTNRNDFNPAIRVLNSSIDAQPTSNRIPELLYLRAVAEIKSEFLDDAYKTLDQIITYYDGSIFAAKSKIELSLLEINKKNFDNALILLKELAEKRLDDIGARAQYLIGLTYYEQNNFNDAIIAFVRVRSVYSSYDEWFTKSLLKLGDCYLKLNDKQQAREMYRAVINRHKTGELAQEANRKLKQL
jgi:TolA-binding protein